MKPHDQGRMNLLGKRLAGPLSRVVAGPATADAARLLESYWSILLGKGAGSGWAMHAEVSSALSTITSPRPTIFDVGANRGEWAIELHRHLPDGRFYLFEPQPDCVRALRACGLPNFTVVDKAVSAENGTARLYADGAASPIASLHQRRDSYFDDLAFGAVDVGTVTLDRVIQDLGVRAVDFLKMDIEGHELQALEGGRESLAAGVVKALSFEFGSGNINSRTYFRDFWDLLTGHGYRIFRILPSDRMLPIRDYYEDCEHFRGVTNYVAVLAR